MTDPNPPKRSKRSQSKAPAPKKSPARVGRPAHEPTDQLRKQVELMAGFGNSADEIAEVIGVSIPTLRQYYSMEIRLGRTKANNAVMLNLYRQANKNDLKAVPAIQLWLKTFAEPRGAAVPERERDEPLGKKAQRDIEAQTAEEGTSWADVLH